jgi:hypothetical protein
MIYPKTVVVDRKRAASFDAPSFVSGIEFKQPETRGIASICPKIEELRLARIAPAAHFDVL